MKKLVVLVTLLLSVCTFAKENKQIANYDKSSNKIQFSYLVQLPEAQRKEMLAIQELMKARQTDKAMKRNDVLLSQFKMQLKKDSRKAIASHPHHAMTLLNLTRLANDKQSGYLVSHDWLVPFYLHAYGLIEKGDISGAMQGLNETLAFSPYDPQTLNERGHLYSVLKEWDNAGKDFSLALEMSQLIEHPAFQSRALRGLGFVAIEKKQWDKAVGFFQQALKINPNDKRAKGELKYIEQIRNK